MKKTGNTTIENRKKYWQTLDERTAPARPVESGPEFGVSKNEMVAELKKTRVTRKNFLKFMGAGATIVAAACRRPTEQIVPAVIQPPEQVPGVPLTYTTVSPSGTPLLVRTMEGRPVKVLGNTDHPLYKGAVASGEVPAVWDLYDPDRLRRPVRLKNGKKKRATRKEILDETKEKLAEGNYVLLTGPVDSPSSRALINNFLGQIPGGRHVEYRPDPVYRQIAAGQQVSYGNSIIPYFRFDRADLVVSIDGDFLGSMLLPAMQTRAFTEKRNLKNGRENLNRLVVFESMYTTTGSNADLRAPIRPGDQTVVALALAAHITIGLGQGGFTGNGRVRNLLSNYTVEKVGSKLGIEAGLIEKVAEELWKNRGRSLVIGGSPLAATGQETSLQVAINLLNNLLNNDGKTVDYENALSLSAGVSDLEMNRLVAELKGGEVSTVIVAGINPVYHLPKSLKVAEALSKVDYVLSISDRIDETAKTAKAVLPLSHYMEAWSDHELLPGLRSVQQPVIRPLWDSLPLEDYLIQLAGGTLGGSSSYYEFVKGRWNAGTWKSVLQTGFQAQGLGKLAANAAGRRFNENALGALPNLPEIKEGLRLGSYYHISVLDGSGANNAYRQELPDPVTKVVWTNYAAMLPDTARKFKLKQGSVIKIKTATGTAKLPVHLIPGLHPDALIIPLGYGRTAAGKVADGRGVNALDLCTTGNDSLAMSGIPVELQATGDREDVPNTQTIFRTGRTDGQTAPFAPEGMPSAPYDASTKYPDDERLIVLETSLKEFKKAKGKLVEQTVKHPTNAGLMDGWEYDALRWHMVIDMNQCTGCGACVTSCNNENNIPVVGPEEVIKGREMHWLRIDRYFSGDETNPQAVHQPMICQHCENAPCENVCPVGATSHTSEGLNVMTYNRCVGTRYCANNCPYKVRKFNWFENWYYMEGAQRELREPQQLGLNPSVTVRSRGVIEKCSFCVQRINLARREMKAQGKKRMVDGTVVTACQEVCPADAITFGDINDPQSEVARLSEDKRGYKVLDFLDVKPSVTYLGKVRNPL